MAKFSLRDASLLVATIKQQQLTLSTSSKCNGVYLFITSQCRALSLDPSSLYAITNKLSPWLSLQLYERYTSWWFLWSLMESLDTSKYSDIWRRSGRLGWGKREGRRRMIAHNVIKSSQIISRYLIQIDWLSNHILRWEMNIFVYHYKNRWESIIDRKINEIYLITTQRYFSTASSTTSNTTIMTHMSNSVCETCLQTYVTGCI